MQKSPAADPPAADDERRMAWLGERGIRVLRVPAREVSRDESLDGVLETIAAMAREASLS